LFSFDDLNNIIENVAHNIKFKIKITNKKMFEKSEANTLDNYKALKSNVVLPLKIKLFYSLLEDLNQKNGSLTSSVSKDQAKKYKNFIAGFKRLAED
jgi:hypothetical protein